MAKKTLKFSRSALEKLSIPSKGYDTYYDTKTSGFAMRVMAGGTKSFFVSRKIEGTAHRVTIGRLGQITLDQARKQAEEINALFAQGIDPNQSKRALRQDLCFSELFDRYIEQHAKKHKKTWGEDAATYTRYLSKLANKRLMQINRHDLEKLHSKVGKENGIYAANRMLALLSNVFRKAIDWGADITNPATGIKKFKEKSRERFLQADELPRFIAALERMSNTDVRDYIWISLLTGARQANVLSMKWDDVNLQVSVWHIPQTKNGEAHSVPLVAEIVELLKKRQSKTESEYVFPSKASATGHMVEPRKAWLRLLDDAQLKDVRLHDLRRTLGSWQASTGASLAVIGKTLAHKNVTTTSIYARLNLDPVRESLETATQAMLQLSDK